MGVQGTADLLGGQWLHENEKMEKRMGHLAILERSKRAIPCSET